MADYTTEEGWHTLPDSHKVYTKTWTPKAPPVALLLFIHGFSDHINSYYTFFPTLASRSIEIHALDQRGWGRSVQHPSQKGLTGPTPTVLDDISSVLQTLIPIAKEKDIPLFLMGHSMGGGEVLQYAARGPTEIRSQIRGYLGESPYIALHPTAQPHRMTVIAGRMVSKVVPKRQMLQKLNPQWVSRDASVQKEWAEDPLCHDTGTLEGLAGMLDRGHELDTGLVIVDEGSFWIGHGDGDRVTSYDASRRWFESLKVEDKEFKTYEGWFHKLHAEPGEDKITFANDVADWIFARTTAGGAQEVKSKL